MSRTLATMLVATVLSSVLAALIASPGSAAACKIIAQPIDEASLRNTAQWAEVVVVGSVVSHSRSYGNERGQGTARVRVDATLKGTPPRELEFRRLGDECGGGAQLWEGETVLLAARMQNPDAATPVWMLAPVTGKTLLNAAEASASIVPTIPMGGAWHAMGTPGDAVRQWAKASGASGEQTRAALEAIGAPVSPSPARLLAILAAMVVSGVALSSLTHRGSSAPIR